jgi:MFS family permease
VLLLLALPRVPASARAAAEAPRATLQTVRVLLPAMALGSAFAYMAGDYDAIWSLNMARFQATTTEIGLSFALFALPIVLLGGVAGNLSDRLGRRLTALFSVAAAGAFSVVYAVVTSVPLLIWLGLPEGALTIAGQPATMAEVSRLARPGEQGRTQGLYQSATYGAQFVGAVSAGALFSLRPAYAFLSVAAVSAACVLVGGLLWREDRPRPQAG